MTREVNNLLVAEFTLRINSADTYELSEAADKARGTELRGKKEKKEKKNIILKRKTSRGSEESLDAHWSHRALEKFCQRLVVQRMPPC